MAADDEQVGVVLVGRVAEHGPGIPLDHLDESVHRVGDADLARPVDDGLGHLEQVGLHVPYRLGAA